MPAKRLNRPSEKPCTQCGKYQRTSGKSFCRDCYNKRRKPWLEKNRKHINILQRVNKYGLTYEQVEAMLAKNSCDICGSSHFLHIDHDHNTGKVRGLLCAACNTFLGRLEKYRDKLSDFFNYLDTNEQARD